MAFFFLPFFGLLILDVLESIEQLLTFGFVTSFTADRVTWAGADIPNPSVN